jgi:hypothetical protein
VKLIGWENVELQALVEPGWELRDSPYLLDACKAIEAWHNRRLLARFERRAQEYGHLVRLLRETDPDRIGREVPA